MFKYKKTHHSKLRKYLLLITILSVLALAAVGCLQLPIEQRPVLNTLESDYPEDTTLPASDDQNESNDSYDNTDQTSDNKDDQTDQSESSSPTNSDTDHETETEETTESTQVTENEVISQRPETSIMPFELEGMLEEDTAELFVSRLGYSFYYVPERYSVFPEVSSELTQLPVDEIWPVMPVSELPDMFIRIAYLADMNSAEAADYMLAEIQDDYAEISRPVTLAFGEEDYKTLFMRAKNGHEWESEIAEIYVIEKNIANHVEGSYLLISTFFVGAEEGHGSRFNQMLNTFYIES